MLARYPSGSGAATAGHGARARLKRAGVCVAIWMSVVAVLAATSSTAMAAEGSLVGIDPQEIRISGFLDEPASLVRTLTVRADGGDVAGVGVFPKLASTDGSTLDAAFINVVAAPVKDGQYGSILIKAVGVNSPGVWTGELRLPTGGRAPSDPQALKVPMTVELKERPTVKTIVPDAGSPLKLRLTDCRLWISCLLAEGAAVPKPRCEWWNIKCWVTSKRPGELPFAAVVLADQGRGPVTIESARLAALGSFGGTAFPTDPTKDWPQSISPGASAVLPLKASPRAAPPDHYVGFAILKLKDKPEPISIPVDISLRVGPLWVIVALLAGIGLGRLAVYMQEKGNPQAAQLMELHRLAWTIKTALPADQATFDEQLHHVEELILRFDLDTAKDELTKLWSIVGLLGGIRKLEAELAGKIPPAKAEKLRTDLEAARGEMAVDLYGDAILKLQAIRTWLQRVFDDAARAGTSESRLLVRRSSQLIGLLDTSALEAAIAGRAIHKLEFHPMHRLRAAFLWVAGVRPEVAAEFRMNLVRPILAVALLVVLAGLGFTTLYLTADSFGAKGFGEYVALAFWGLGADVARRALVLGAAPAAAAAPAGH
jgi:hypothetical protein